MTPTSERMIFAVRQKGGKMSRTLNEDDVLKEIDRWIGYLDEDMITRIKISIKKIPSVQTENAYCIYCHEDSDGYVKPIEKNGHAFVRFGMNGWEISLEAKGWNGSAKIMYCPMCGRKLKK